jgi:hypothetical protein
MNKQRRKEIYKLITKLQKVSAMQSDEEKNRELEDIKDDVNLIMLEEEIYMDNIPENLQGGRRYSDAEDACDNLYSAIDSLEDAIGDVESMDEYISKAISYLNTASM